MKVFMIGGTGLLGSQGAKELIDRGHSVMTLALPPLPPGAELPPEMEIEFGNYLEMSDEEILGYMDGCEGFVFAAGVDERVEGPAPIYNLYKKYNIDPVDRLLKLAKKAGIKHSVICGSYFSYFAKVKPELELTKNHPYIRSRIDQENVAMAQAEEGFDVCVLELPYIFGTQPGRKPVWVFLAEMIEGKSPFVFYPTGGSTMVTVKQVGEALAGGIEYNKGGNCYPIGYYNYNWKQLIAVSAKAMGYKHKKVITIAKWMYALGSGAIMLDYKKKGIQGGLHMIKFADMQCSELFIDKELGCVPLHVQPDDIDAAIGDSMKLSQAIIRGETEVISMKGE